MSANPPDTDHVPPSGTPRSVPAPRATGIRVVVPADSSDRTALTARLATLGQVRHPHLVAVTEVRQEPGAFDVVHARGEAADLPAVLAVRGHLAAAEAAAVGVHVAQALAALHAAGLVHGPLEPSDVVLRAGGEPALRPRPMAAPPEWTPAEDVRAVARLVDGLLGSRTGPGTVPAALAGDPLLDPDGAVRGSLTDALGADPSRRPEAGTLAARIDGACEPAPVRLPDPATLAGAALAGMLRAQAPGQETSSTRGRRRTRAASGGTKVPGGAAGTTRVTGTRGRAAAHGGAGERGTARAARRALGRRVHLPAMTWRPALIVVGVGLTVGVASAAALSLRDAHHDPGAVQAAPTTATQAQRPAEPQPTQDGASPSPEADPSPVVDPVRDPVLDRDDPAAAAEALTQRRLDALSSDPAGARAALGSVDVAGSPAHAADIALLDELAGTRPDGPMAVVAEHTVLARTPHETPDTATVQLTYVIGEHQQVAADGTRSTVPESAEQSAVLDLVWTDGGWRVTDVG